MKKKTWHLEKWFEIEVCMEIIFWREKREIQIFENNILITRIIRGVEIE